MLSSSLYNVCSVRQGEFWIPIPHTKDTPKYPVFGGAKLEIGYHEMFNVVENSILMNVSGKYAGEITRFATPVFLTNQGYVFTNTSFEITDNYLFFYLKYMLQPKIRKLAAKGKIGEIMLLTIDIPSKEIQETICSALQVFYQQDLSTPSRRTFAEDVYEEHKRRQMLSLLQCYGKPFHVSELRHSQK